MRLCLATAYDDAYSAMGDLCAASLARYAAAHGLELCVSRTLPDTGRPPAWAKIPVIERLLDDGCDFVLWVDADAVVVRAEPDIRAEIAADKNLYLACHQLTGSPMPGMTVSLDVPNTGVMLLRNTLWTRDFLRAVWAREAYLRHRWWENAAVLEVMGYHRLLDSAAINAPDPAVMARVKWLDWNWNSIPGACEGRSPIIRHHTRADSLPQRVAAMQRDLEASLRGGP